jgi:hypothetical protein
MAAGSRMSCGVRQTPRNTGFCFVATDGRNKTLPERNHFGGRRRIAETDSLYRFG